MNVVASNVGAWPMQLSKVKHQMYNQVNTWHLKLSYG